MKRIEHWEDMTMQVKGEAFDGNCSPASLDLYDYDWKSGGAEN